MPADLLKKCKFKLFIIEEKENFCNCHFFTSCEAPTLIPNINNIFISQKPTQTSSNIFFLIFSEKKSFNFSSLNKSTFWSENNRKIASQQTNTKVWSINRQRMRNSFFFWEKQTAHTQNILYFFLSRIMKKKNQFFYLNIGPEIVFLTTLYSAQDI